MSSKLGRHKTVLMLKGGEDFGDEAVVLGVLQAVRYIRKPQDYGERQHTTLKSWPYKDSSVYVSLSLFGIRTGHFRCLYCLLQHETEMLLRLLM